VRGQGPTDEGGLNSGTTATSNQPRLFILRSCEKGAGGHAPLLQPSIGAPLSCFTGKWDEIHYRFVKMGVKQKMGNMNWL